jgi:hypothetical protein
VASLRELAGCIGLPDNFALVGDFFGYASAPPWNLAPSQNLLPQSLSVLTQAKRLQLTHFHVNVIRVGASEFDGLMNAIDEQNLDCAVQMTRDIYAPFGIGIGRVIRWWMIQNTSYETIDDDGEAEDLVDEYTVTNDGVDCFFVPLYKGGIGGITEFDGVVVQSRVKSKEGGFPGTARSMAHEFGHYFGLGHENGSPGNLMCQSTLANPMPGGTNLNDDQVDEMKTHVGPVSWKLLLTLPMKQPC